MNIKQKLIALLLFIGLIPTVAVAVIAFAAVSNGLRSNTTNQLASLSIKQEQKISGLLQAKQEEVVRLINKFEFQIALGQYFTANRPSDKSAILAQLQNKKVEVPDIQALSVADLEGKVFASTLDSMEGQNITDQDYFLGSGNETSIAVREDPRDGINKLYITTVVSVNKKESAFLSVVYRIDDIIAAIQDYTGLGASGETVIVENNDGNAISLFPLRFDTDAALKKNLNSLQLFAHVGKTYERVTDYRDKEVIVSARSIGFANWVLATKIDSDEALAPILQLRDALLGIGLISSLAIIGIALYFARFFTGPILRVAEVARLIGHGNFSARLSNMDRKDEIGELATSINTMGTSLHDFVSSIEAQRNRLEIILNSAEESILAVNKAGEIIIANQATAELVGMSIREIVGKRIDEVFSWTRETQAFAIDYNAPGANTYADLQFVNRAGVTHFVRLVVAKVSGEQEQKAAQTIVTIHDETKSRELEAMKIDFVSMAAHELRTPLAAIRGYIELLTYKQGEGLNAEAQKYLAQAHQSTAELGSLINNLLDVTRIERGTLSFDLEKVNIAQELQQAVEEAQFSANEKYVELRYEGETHEALIAADQIAIREVINNLLANAIKYTNPGGKVTVSLRKENDKFTARFTDTGIGIPKQSLPNLFTKFYRVRGGLSSGSTGTGLGLFISKSIIERHGGSISVSSQEGIGSTFSFTLPKFDESKTVLPKKHIESIIMNERGSHGWITQNIDR